MDRGEDTRRPRAGRGWDAAIAVLVVVVAATLLGGAHLLGVASRELAAMAALATAVALLTARRASRPRFDAIDAARDALETRIDAAALDRLALRARAHTAGRFREEFVAAVRHELNTPLNAILGFADVLLQEVDGPLEPAQREDVDAIRAAGAYLSELVEAVLEEWAPDRTPKSTALAPIEPLLREVARLLGGQLVDRDVALRVEVDDPALEVRADPRRLRQILINLGTNAIRATRRGAVTLAATRGDGGVRLEVRDTGRGIPEDELPRLFDELVQGGDAANRRGGTGLGLALTRDLVAWHGGRIEVTSTVGEGTTFHVWLPTEERR